MLTLLSQEDSRSLLAWFKNADYTETNLRNYLGSPELPSRAWLRNHAWLS